MSRTVALSLVAIVATCTGCGEQADSNEPMTSSDASGTTGEPVAEPLPPFKADGGFLALGAQVYDRRCLTCHEYDGRGVPGMAPTLHDAPLMVGDDQPVIRAILAGINTSHPAALTADTDWPGGMAGMASAMSDQEVAAVLTYIRRQWTDDDRAISPEAVRREREATIADR
ncbi:MAG: cytochrome c [Planctomycetota bacterium]